MTAEVAPTFFVCGHVDDEMPLGVVIVLGDRMVQVSSCWLRDPANHGGEKIPGIELRPLAKAPEGDEEMALSGGPLAVVALRNAQAVRVLRAALDAVERMLTGSTERDRLVGLVKEWIGKQGHDRCWYYPDIFAKIAEVLGIPAADKPALPPRAEFEGGCSRYQQEQYGGLPKPLYPRIEVPVVEGRYWRQHRLWEVMDLGSMSFVHAGVTRPVSDVPGPWFGTVPPPEDWK